MNDLVNRIYDCEKKIAVLESKNEIVEKRLEGIEEDMAEIKSKMDKATYWFIGILLTIVGTFALDKFFV